MRLSASLSVRLALAAALIGVVGSVVVYINLKTRLEHDFEQSAVASASSMTEIIRRSTRAGMLQNHWQEVHDIIRNIHQQPDIVRIRLINKEGRVVFSSDAKEIGSVLDVRATECRGCHDAGQPRADLPRNERVRIFSGPAEERVLGMIEPIQNEPECAGSCHVHPPDQRVLGLLDTQLSLAASDRQASSSTGRVLFGSVLVIMFTAAGIVAAHVKMLRGRLRPMLSAIGRLGKGDYGARMPAGLPDEMAGLRLAFNRMVADLEETHGELQRWALTLQERVEARTRELHQTQEQVITSERMASLGRLAAVVAHELNNPLAGVLVLARRARKTLAKDTVTPEKRAEIASWLEMVDNEVARCGKIVTDLLAFSRHRAPGREPVDLNDLVQRASRLLAHKLTLGEIDLQLHLQPDLPAVVADPGQIQQVLMILMTNAVEAMPSGGTLSIATRSRPGGGVILEVGDTGSGIRPADLPRIFEPFFSTKAEGLGVGLGLAVAFGIVNRHGGRIDAASTSGQGTRMTVQLPPEPPPGEEEPHAGKDHLSPAAGDHLPGAPHA